MSKTKKFLVAIGLSTILTNCALADSVLHIEGYTQCQTWQCVQQTYKNYLDSCVAMRDGKSCYLAAQPNFMAFLMILGGRNTNQNVKEARLAYMQDELGCKFGYNKACKQLNLAKDYLKNAYNAGHVTQQQINYITAPLPQN